MSKPKINFELLKKLEKELNPAEPENCSIPTKVLGYGEISTVIEIGTEEDRNQAYKRMPMFKNIEESDNYLVLYKEYLEILSERIALNLVPSDIVMLPDESKGIVTGYITQEKLPSESIGHKAIHFLSPEHIQKLVLTVLIELKKVFEFNNKNNGTLELGIDGQISNWAIKNFDPKTIEQSENFELLYLDTSTPLIQKDGIEQLNPELFLRSAPSFLVWIIRWLFLEDVITRYYDFRKVVIDLIANFYKEQREDLIPGLLEIVNKFFDDEIQNESFKSITEKEVKSYYREDAWIWRIYLAFRKVDRFLHKLLGKHYPYILPEKIKR
jgi:hypothetical protein